MKVKDQLTRETWKQGATQGGARCLLLHIDGCYRSTSEFMVVYGKVYSRVRNIVSWNDAPGRTFEEVKSLVEELDI